MREMAPTPIWLRRNTLIVVVAFAAAMIMSKTRETKAFTPQHHNRPTTTFVVSRSTSATALLMTDEPQVTPTTFREAEILGLKLMQDGIYDEALKVFQQGLQLPGSRSDVVRTKLLSGPSPVGGSTGGMETKNVETLDEFEMQACYYNMACAHAQLGNAVDAIQSLQTSLENGFDNFATIRNDPDLAPIRSLKEFEKLMEAYEPKNKGFNPFGLFGGKK